MNIANMRKYDASNGPGIRATLFVSGCTHNCEGCFNKKYQDFQYGHKMTEDDVSTITDYMISDKIVGLNILGGEPLQQLDGDLLHLLKRIKAFTNKPIWIWSGYTLEEILDSPHKDKVIEILSYADVLIDGRFQEELKDLSLKYRGSSNQRVIDLKKTFHLGRICEIDV